MNLLMLSDAVGGVWTYTIELVAALADRGWSVSVATMGPPPGDHQRENLLSILGVELHESTFPLEWQRPEAEELERSSQWLLGLEHELAPDVVHLNSFCHAAFGWSTPVVVAAHSCVLSWHYAVRKDSVSPDWRVYAERVTQGIRAADAVVAPSSAMLAALERWYGISGPSYVIPNGRDPRCVAPGPKDRYIFSAGRLWDEAKNLAALAAVAPDLTWPVIVAGPSTYEGAGTFVPGNLQTLGSLPWTELRDWLARAPIFALPALYEPFGLGPLEAGFAGCALVLGDIPSLREVWEDAALFVDPLSRASLADAIGSLIRDPRSLAEMGERARARAGHFSPVDMADRYMEVYAGVIGTPATSRDTR